jgi:MFS family permease
MIMMKPLAHPTYRRLFLAQVGSLLGTGLATVALGLLAFQLAGKDAGLVLGTALAIKMIAYVGVAPVVGAYASALPRRAFLIALDVVRAVIVLLLPFVDQVWQVYVLIFLLQSASAAFTPTFQATIPDILPDERDYTQALSLSRLAYDLESLASSAIAAALLTVISFHWLFAGTAIGFLVSAALVLSVSLPISVAKPRSGGIYDRTTHGMRTYLATPRLRGLLALNLAAAAAGAMVIVNTVVYVRTVFAGGESDVAIALAAFGAGSMVAALLLPRVLDTIDDRTVMLAGAAGLCVCLVAFGLLAVLGLAGWAVFISAWLLIGASYSTVLTPSGRLLRRSSTADDRPALFAAQFALSHACWLLTYPLAGWLGAGPGLTVAMFVLAGLAALGVAAAVMVWPAHDPDVVEHRHDDLPSGHPHLVDASSDGRGHRHAHPFVIDQHHPRWPAQA